VYIDSSLEPGHMTVGGLLLCGKSRREVLFSTYFCHPSLANDNLSGLVLQVFLARELSKRKLKFSYRFLFAPETIGSLAYFSHNPGSLEEIGAGLVLTCVGGPRKFRYKQSFESKHYINRYIEETLTESGDGFEVCPFDIHGSDERQYSSPGFRINTASIHKDKYYEYAEYLTSLDNLDLVNAEKIFETYELYLRVIEKMESDSFYERIILPGEVMLSQYGLYPETGGGQTPQNETQNELDLLLGFLFHCDGVTPLSQIAGALGMSLGEIKPLADKLIEKGVLAEL